MQFQSKQCLMDIDSESKPNSRRQIRPTWQKQEWINSFWWSATCGREMGKCCVFIPSHSHQAKLPFLFPWN